MVTYTSSNTYWQPLRPRLNIYAFDDTGYSSPLYTYNAFTDVGTDAKLIALSFDSDTLSVGNFSLEIEDSGNSLDVNTFTKGNRVFVECSKDGSTWHPAFKGVIRSCIQKIFATTGKNIILEGYSFLIRLNERIVNTIIEAALIPGTGNYDRTDTTMNTNNLVDELLSSDIHYVQSRPDSALYFLFKKNNILSSPVEEWIPRIDGQLTTLSNILNRILESSNGLIMLDPADDELMLYTSDLITPANDIFLLTNSANTNADDADITMYPLEEYTYDISYDFPDSGSRFIGSIGPSECPPAPPTELAGDNGESVTFYGSAGAYVLAPAVEFTASGPIRNLSIACETTGNNSSGTGASARIFRNTIPSTGYGSISSQLGNAFPLYVNGRAGTPFPNISTHAVIVSQPANVAGPTIEAGKFYWLAVQMLHTQTMSNRVHWRTETPFNNPTPTVFQARYAWSTNGGSTWNIPPLYLAGENNSGNTFYKWKWSVGFGSCGGLQITSDTNPVFVIAEDRNMSNRLGVVERVTTGIPAHIKTAQTLNEYLFNTVYFAAKPRFTYDFPSVSIPNKLPKAGDIIAHVDLRTNVGLKGSPIQTGVIASIRYNFTQSRSANSPLGLKRLAISTTGIKRGSY